VQIFKIKLYYFICYFVVNNWAIGGDPGDNIKIIFFVPEAQLSQIKLQQKISFSCDGCSAPQTAVISYISPTAEYTPPVIYSRSARAKLVYRVEALTPIADATKYHPGQPIDVTF